MVRVVLNLTKNQLRKLNSGKAFQLSHSQLMGQSGDHPVELDVDRKLGNKIHRSSINGKGFRLPKGLVSGAMNAGAKLAKANAGKLADMGANMASQAVQNQIAKSTYIPENMKGTVGQLANAGISNIKTSGLNKVNSRLSEFEGEGFGSFVKTMKKVGTTIAPIAKIVAKTALPVAGTMAGAYIGQPGLGSMAGQMAANSLGKGLKRPAKGSAEAKERMARLRAMKGKGIMDIAKKGVKLATPYAQQAIKKYGADAAGMLAQRTGLVDPNIARQLTQGAITATMGRGVRGNVVNPRMKVPGRILRNGIDQNIHGGSFAGWSYT